MTTIASSSYSNDTGYFHNLGLAARGFLGALLASKPYQASASTASVTDERYVRPSNRDIALLTSEAARYEKLMPNLASELRFMASRG